MEALQTDGQFGVGASLVKSLALAAGRGQRQRSGREGAMIALPRRAPAASSDASRRVRNGVWMPAPLLLQAWRALTMRRWRAACLSRRSVRYLNAGFPRPGCRFPAVVALLTTHVLNGSDSLLTIPRI